VVWSLRKYDVVVGCSSKPVTDISGCGLNCRDCVVVSGSISGSSGAGEAVGVGSIVVMV
jgi:hypothetical protein